MRSVVGGLMLLVVGVGGWLLGSFYPAPPQVQALVGRSADDLRLQAEHIDWGVLLKTLSPAQVEALQAEASKAAAAAGDAILVESVREADYAETETTAMPTSVGSTAAPPAPPAPGAFESGLTLCPRMTVNNAPKPAEFAAIVDASGVRLAVNPTQGACLSSGFGARGGGIHKGLDYHSETGGPIMAAADGVVLERKYPRRLWQHAADRSRQRRLYALCAPVLVCAGRGGGRQAQPGPADRFDGQYRRLPYPGASAL